MPFISYCFGTYHTDDFSDLAYHTYSNITSEGQYKFTRQYMSYIFTQGLDEDHELIIDLCKYYLEKYNTKEAKTW